MMINKSKKFRILRFFSMLFGGCNGGYVELRPFDLNYELDFENRTWVSVHHKQILAKRLWKLRQGHLFYGVATRTEDGKIKTKGTKEYLKELPALFVDMDRKDFSSWKTMKEILYDFPFEPSCIVFSGHGLHAYYFLDPPVEVKGNLSRVERVLRVLQTKMLRGDETSDASRVLRAPYSHNVKNPSKPKLVKVKKLEDIRYSLKDFEDQFSRLLQKERKAQESSKLQPSHEVAPEDSHLSTKIRRLINQGKNKNDDYKSRSEADMAVICGLLRAGYTEEEIIELFRDYPDGIGEKYREKGKWGDRYLKHSIHSAREFLRTN